MDAILTSTESLAGTLAAAEAARRVWDVLVIGAGPAGSMAAHELARRGLATLLVDRSSFPRYKVCGACLSAAALGQLTDMGLGALPESLGGIRLDRFRLWADGRQATIRIPAGLAVSRQAFDAALVKRAIGRGAAFLPRTSARLDSIEGPQRAVYLQTHEDRERLQRVNTRVVLVADGLGGRTLLGERGFGRRRWAHSRIGAGAVFHMAPESYTTGIIYMACAAGGYVGLVRTETGELNVASAFRANFVRDSGGPGQAAMQVLHRAGLPAGPWLAETDWSGTPWLTSAPLRPAAERLFVLGDAAGYIEPFTGEGMTWAIASARAVTPLVIEAVERWRPELVDDWARVHRTRIGSRQHLCRLFARGLRHPRLTRGLVTVLQRWPALADPFTQWIHRPYCPAAPLPAG
jgi:flavin-dependent dehydrogenase